MRFEHQITDRLTRSSPSNYAVFAVATKYDGCGVSLGNFGPITQSFAPDALSTVQPVPSGTPIPQVFDFQDVPCPPPRIQDQLEPGRLYRPVLAPPVDQLLSSLENASISVAHCQFDMIVDPPMFATWDPLLSPPDDGRLNTEFGTAPAGGG